MLTLAQQLGPYVGLLAAVVLVVLSALYVMHARELRRTRERTVSSSGRPAGLRLEPPEYPIFLAPASPRRRRRATLFRTVPGRRLALRYLLLAGTPVLVGVTTYLLINRVA